MTRVSLHLAALLVFLASLLAGCGGGGASGTPAATAGAGGGGAQPTVVVALVDPSSGATRNSMSVGSPLLAKATVRDATGKGVANTVVTFSVTPAGQVNLTPSVGTALTDANGVASVQVDPAGVTSAGAATVTASVTIGTTTTTGTSTPTTGSASFSIVVGQQPTIALAITDPTSGAPRASIRLGSPATATATVRDAKGAAVANTIVTFSGTPTSQVAFTPAAGTAVTDANGVATAQIDPASLTASGAVTLAATAQVGSVTIAGTTNITITVGATSQQQVSIALTDATSGAAVTSISLGKPAKATATVLDSTGKVVPSSLVTFTVTPVGQVTITPAAGTALTDASGVAFVTIDPASLSSSGAATISAVATVGSGTATGATSFTIGAPTLDLSSLTTPLGAGKLSPYGTTTVTATVTGVPTTTPVTVNFSSTCSGSGKATLPASVVTANGQATATYKDNGCAQLDTVTASIAGTTKSKTATIDVAVPGVASIQFVSATPSSIVLKGTGGAGLSESSIVVFKVLDNNSQPIPGANVSLNLTTLTGGILLDGTSVLPLTKQTDANGLVQVAVQAGSNPTAVWVNATTSGFTSQSTVLRISTGRPAQDRFSLAVTTHNIEGLQYDGVTTTFTAFASDRLGNPVPDGTAVNFISEGGQIQPSCTTTNGQCNLVFTSANPRPRNELPPVGFAGVTNGRVTVLAYSLGEESFVDKDGNNIFGGSDVFNDMGDAYLDANENNQWDAGEQYIPFGAGTSACNVGIVNTAVPPVATSPYAPSKAGTCDGSWGQAHVRQQNLVILSGSDAYINTTRPDGNFVPGTTPVNLTFPLAGSCQYTANLYLFDVNRNPMPAGTLLSSANLSKAISSATPGGTPVPDSVSSGGTPISLTIKIADDSCPLLAGSASADLKITTPKGLTTSYTLRFTP